MGASGYHSESCCCAKLRHQCRCHCLLLPRGQMATGLMSRDDELAHHLLPSITVSIKVANGLSSIARLGALKKLTFNYLCLHRSSFQQRLMGVSWVISFTVQHGRPVTGRKGMCGVEAARQKQSLNLRLTQVSDCCSSAWRSRSLVLPGRKCSLWILRLHRRAGHQGTADWRWRPVLTRNSREIKVGAACCRPSKVLKKKWDKNSKPN